MLQLVALQVSNDITHNATSSQRCRLATLQLAVLQFVTLQVRNGVTCKLERKRKLEKKKGEQALKPLPGSQAPSYNNTNSLKQQQQQHPPLTPCGSIITNSNNTSNTNNNNNNSRTHMQKKSAAFNMKQ